uniref:Coiled-coil domain containing 82 n=1 Tax=Athene cunicularia TaxID=194338 RepID=A0A663LQ25_ATHCN
MEIKAAVRRYETRNKTAGTELSLSKSRVDWRRTKRELILFDSDDESSGTSEEEEPTTSEDEVDEKDETVVKNRLLDQEEKSRSEEVTEDGEDEYIVPGKRKRLNTSVLYDSDESEGSDILVRKVFAKRHCIMDEDDSSEEHQPVKTCPTENVSTNRKQKVFAKLKELARQRATWSSESCEDSNGEGETEEEPFCHMPLTSTEDGETDSDSMKDFIVEEEDDDDNTEHITSENQPQQKKLNISNSELLAYYVPHRKIYMYILLVVLQKKYAQDMLLSLHYLDDRFIQPRLENLISRSRWKDRYKERVDCYPDVRIILKNRESKSCQACELNRHCQFNVQLSGKLYNSRTLEVDDFMSDDKQVLKVGVVCANRTRVYHNLKHFKYKLYMDCSSITELDGVEDEPVKDTVTRLFSHLEDSGWIQKRYNDLEDYMNDADNFQEEKMD